MTFCAVSAVAGLSYFGFKALGMAMAIGALLCAPSDLPGNLRHRYKGMLLAIILSVLATLISRYTAGYFYVHTLLVTFLAFGISYFAVYGFRASLVAFSGLLALTLSFASFPADSIWQHALFILIGGLYYLLISSVFFYFHNKTQVDFQLGETARLTADFLNCRLELIQNKNNREKTQQKQIELQQALNEKHEDLRDSLLTSRRKSGLSNSTRRKLLVFITLVDILELALSHPVDFDHAERLRKKHPAIFVELDELLNLLNSFLNQGADFFIDGKKPEELTALKQQLTNTENQLKGVEGEIENLDFIRLKNFLGIEKKHVSKMKSLFRVIGAIQTKNSVSLKTNKYRKFITPVDYSWKIFTENLNFSSIIFRHSLRLSLLFLVSLAIGHFFEFQKSYWILITLIVIMRPNYGLTKERTKMRIKGTIIGAAAAVLIVILFSSPSVFAVLAIISIILGFSMLQENYVGAAAFITVTVIMVYALLSPEAYSIIQYRVVDTFIGAGLVIIGNYFLWPAWEYRNIANIKRESILANRDFLREIDWFYHKKGKLPLSYKLARKNAFLKLGELSAACQRMSQEPKSKQDYFEELYNFTTLSHTMLSSLAGLGTFIRNNPTTEASEIFDKFTAEICRELQQAVNLEKEVENHGSFEESITSLENRHAELKNGQTNEALLNEAQLIYDQLTWLYRLAVQIKAKSKILKNKD